MPIGGPDVGFSTAVRIVGTAAVSGGSASGRGTFAAGLIITRLYSDNPAFREIRSQAARRDRKDIHVPDARRSANVDPARMFRRPMRCRRLQLRFQIVPPSKNCIVPVAMAGVTVAVNGWFGRWWLDHRTRDHNVAHRLRLIRAHVISDDSVPLPSRGRCRRFAISGWRLVRRPRIDCRGRSTQT